MTTDSAFAPPSAMRPSRTTEREGGASLAIILLIILILPNELAFAIGDVVFTPIRFVLFLIAIPVAFRFVVSSRIYCFDILYILFALWTGFSIIVNRGITGVQGAGQFILESVIIYMSAVVFLNSYKKIFQFLSGFVIIITTLVIAAIPEVILERHIILDFFASVMGKPDVRDGLGGERFGIMRAATVFRHPIHFGVFCASAFALVWYAFPSGFGRLWRLGVSVIGAFLAISSGPILALMIQIFSCLIEATTRWLKNRASIFTIGLSFFLVSVHLLASRGLFALVAIFALNPSTAYHRKHIWENGIDDVLRSPLFGIRPETWTRPHWMQPSVDNFWLFQAMQGGIPSVIFLIASIILIVRYVFSRSSQCIDLPIRNFRHGYVFMISSLVICGATVHYFSSIKPFFALMIGLGAAIVRVSTAEALRLEHEHVEQSHRPEASANARRNAFLESAYR